MLGGSLAELASHIRVAGGEVVGVVTLVNASRSGVFKANKRHIRLVEERFGNDLRKLGIEPAALTGDEAQYLVNFPDADGFRAALVKAEGRRDGRLRAKGVSEQGSDKAVNAGVAQAEQALREQLDRLGLKDIRVELVPEVDGSRSNAQYWRKVVSVAFDAEDKPQAVRHEAVHAMRALGLFSPAEWAALERTARETWIAKHRIKERYPDLTEEQQVEEAIAEAFAAWSGGAYQPGGLIQRALATVRRVLQAIREAFSAAHLVPDEVFKRVDSGEVGARRRSEPERDEGPKMQRHDTEALAKEASAGLGHNGGPPMGPTVSGADREFIEDLDLFRRFAFHPRSIAAFDRDFVPVYRAAERQFERRDEIAADLSRLTQPYFELDREARARVDRALELGRLSGTNYTDQALRDGVENEGVDQAALSKPSETLRLSDEEIAGYRGVRKAMNEALDIFKAQLIREWGLDPAEVDTSRKILDLAEASDRDERETLQTLARLVRDVEQAQRTGYVPFSRWGEVAISVSVPDDAAQSELPLEDEEPPRKTVHFEMIELPRLTGNRVARKLLGKELEEHAAVKERLEAIKAKFPQADAQIKVFQVGRAGPLEQGVKLSDLDILAEAARLDDGAWQQVRTALEEQIKKQGFRKHFIRSQNVPGYSTDFERAVADYIVGISGYLARREYQGIWDGAMKGLPAVKPKLRAYAQKYRDYVQNPQEEYQFLRQAAFIWYLAGSPATAMVNATQVPLITAPYMTQFARPDQVTAELARAYKDVALMMTASKGMDLFDPAKAPEDMRADLQLAWDEGFFVPLETWEVMGLAQNRTPALRGLSRKARVAVDAVALQFSAAERLNRLVTFIAAHRLGRKEVVKQRVREVFKGNALARSDALLRGYSPMKLATWVIDETHFRMGKVNRPTLLRGIGTLIGQFKGFLMQSLELQLRMAMLQGKGGRKAMALMLLMIGLSAGLWGLPFAEDLKNLIEKLTKKLRGIDADIETAVRELIVDLTGSPLIAQLFSKGATRTAGVDVSHRTGMGDPLSQLIDQPLGIPAANWERVVQAKEWWNRDQHAYAVAQIMPNFIKNAMYAWLWTNGGVRSEKSGKVVIPKEKVTAGDAAAKAIGFTPSQIANQREAEFAQTRVNTAAADEQREFYGKLARAAADHERANKTNDVQGAAAAKKRMDGLYAEIAEKNSGRPDYQKVVINQRVLKERIREELIGAEARDAKAPRKARSRREEIERVYGVD